MSFVTLWLCDSKQIINSPSASLSGGYRQRSAVRWEFYPSHWHWELLNKWWPLAAAPWPKKRVGSTLLWRAVGARHSSATRLWARPTLCPALTGPPAGSHTQTQVRHASKKCCLSIGTKTHYSGTSTKWKKNVQVWLQSILQVNWNNTSELVY